jgi:RecA-family ATPase
VTATERPLTLGELRAAANARNGLNPEPAQQPENLADANDLARYVEQTNWADFWKGESPEQEWLIDQIIPAGRQVAMYSAPKQGKSLLALDAAAALATGRSVLGCKPVEPVDVVYIDQEMTEADLRARLEDLGYGPEADMSRLHYYQLVALPPLDTPLGGEVLGAIVKHWRARLVVLDTMARVVTGDEGSADTYRDFYRCTGVKLKVIAVALWRLDHSGKDPAKGQRGSSEKAGDVDVVFGLKVSDDVVTLTRTHTRVPWVPAQVTLRRLEDPLTAHVLEPEALSPRVVQVIAALERLAVPIDAGSNEMVKELKDAGEHFRRTDILEAVKVRKKRGELI